MGKASFCVKCGRKLGEGENFCISCGTKVAELECETNGTKCDKKEHIQERLNNEISMSENPKINSNKRNIIIGSIVVLIIASLIGLRLYYDMTESKRNNSLKNAEKIQQEESIFVETEVTEDDKKDEAVNMIDHSEEYVGGWCDLYSNRCWMSIEKIMDNRYAIEIQWSGGATETYRWEFIGSYDEVQNGIVYSGDSIYEYYDDEGNAKKEYLYTDGEGLLYIADDGYLYWNDWKENAGSECFFQKD